MYPEFSAITAKSFGFLASNNSATLGNPPVISLVLDAAWGVLAKISPAWTSAPSDTDKRDSGGRKYLASLPLANIITSPLLSLNVILGFRSTPLGLAFQSLTFMLVRPVFSSVSSVKDMPDCKST